MSSEDTENITIKLYDKIQIIYADATDNQIKKYETKSSDGFLEINLNEKTNEIHLVLYSSLITNGDRELVNNSAKTVHLDIKLSEFNFANFVGKRVEFKSNKVFDLTSFYAIDFGNDNDYYDLKNTLNSLKEIYIDEKMDSLSETDFFMTHENQQDDSMDKIVYKECKKIDCIADEPYTVEELCRFLKECILKGDVENSIKYVTDLAKLKPNLNISIASKTEYKSETIKQDPHINKIELIFKNNNNKKYTLYLNASTTTILDLKQKILDDYQIPIEYQFIVVNDCSTNDGDKLDFYDQQQSFASCSTKKTEYIVHLFVFSNTLNEWNCSNCTFINPFDTQKCQMCQNKRTDTAQTETYNHLKDTLEFKIFNEQLQEKMKKQRDEKYFEMAAFYNLDLNENIEPFDCDICMEKEIPPREGVILKECLHIFCKNCLISHINYSEDSTVRCPFGKDYNCAYNIQDREIRALLNADEYHKIQLKSLRQSEAAMNNTFHCLLPDCIGFCVYEDNLNFFDCPVCEKVNCLRCNVIHMGKTCKEYQDDLKTAAVNDVNAKKDIKALEEMVKTKKAMHCPGCKIILCKNDGCDWLVCPMCKIEICWATRGPRWGPNGKGDITGGCQCNFAQGKPCAKDCRNCH